MATFKKTRAGGMLVKRLALAAALCAAGVAQAGVLNFEGAPVVPWTYANETVTDGKYWMTTYGGEDGDMTGMFINGADQADICSGTDLKCPMNNSSSYYAALADSYMVFGLNSGGEFHLNSFSASYIGTGSTTYTRGLLVLQGFGADGFALGGALQVALPSAVGGNYNFGTVNLGGFFDNAYAKVLFVGYGCNAAGNCFRDQNGSNFAIDDITTTEEVPEPATLGMIGLGLLGMGALRRRKHAA